MAPAKVSEVRSTVFIFLDENMPTVTNKTFSGFMKAQQSRINIIPFPLNFKGKKVVDCEVVAWIKKSIFSGWHQIGDSVSAGENPIFVFFTADLNFIEDAWFGIISKQEDKKEKFTGIYFYPKEYTIIFVEGKREVTMRVCGVHQKNGRRKGVLINHMIQMLRDILFPSKLP